MGKGEQSAKPDIDYEHVEGTLEFKHTESKKTISIPIIQKEDENAEREEMFGLKLYDAEPAIVKVSKKDTAIIEIVTDSERKRQADAVHQLLERINHEENITWG